jgi:hypothetical protein
MAGYTRQRTIADGNTIAADLFNGEYNAIVSAFNVNTGHKHDGTAAEGPVIGLIGDAGLATPLNKIVVDTTNDHLEFYVDVSGAATEQLRIEDGAIVPITDNDIDLGTSSLEFKDLYIDGVAYVDSLAMPTTTVTDILDEDNMSSDSATALSTQQSIKAYVDAQVATIPVGDITSVVAGTGMTGGGTSGDVTLNVIGGTGIDANANDIAIDNTVVTLTGSQVLTGKTIDVDNNTVSNIEVDNLKSGVLDTDITSVSSSDDTLASAKAIKTYVDAQVATVPTGDITAVVAGTGLSGGATSGSATLAIDTATTVDISTSQTLTNKILTSPTLTSPVLNTSISGTAFKDEDNMSSDSATAVASQQSIKAYVDAQVATVPVGDITEVIAGTGLSGGGASGSVTLNAEVSASSTNTFTNKTIDADGTGNSITNIDNANIKAAAAIDATKIADGSVTSTEFQFINSLSSNAQTQLDAKQATIDSSNRLNANLIHDGSVDNTEFGYLNGVTSAIQTQINTANTNINTKASNGFAVAMAIAL